MLFQEDSSFRGRVALVTGGGAGIGAATCRQLDRAGAHVIVADVDERAASQVANGLERGESVALDVTDFDLVGEVVGSVAELAVVVHAAGVDDPQAKRVMADAMARAEAPLVTPELDIAAWNRVVRTNLDGSWHVLQAAVRSMLPRQRGSVVLVGSAAGLRATSGLPHYTVSKAAVHALAQSVAKELAPRGIRVNAVAPGPVETSMATRTPDPMRERLVAGGFRYATADEIATLILFLSSDHASNIVGEVVLTNGGRFTA